MLGAALGRLNWLKCLSWSLHFRPSRTTFGGNGIIRDRTRHENGETQAEDTYSCFEPCD